MVTETMLTERLAEAPIVPLVQANNPSTAIAITRALVAGGLRVVEVVLRDEFAMECLGAVADAVPEATVGAGTVITTSQAEASIEAGAQFIVSPGLHPEIVETVMAATVPIIPGVATASEVQLGWNMGLRTLKFFPASLAGGPAMLKAYGSVFPDISFMPTGGVTIANLVDYLSLSNVVACGGSWLTPVSAVESEYFQKITELAAEAVTMAGMVRSKLIT